MSAREKMKKAERVPDGRSATRTNKDRWMKKALVLFLLLLGSCGESNDASSSQPLGGVVDSGCTVTHRLLFTGDSLTAGANTPAKDGFRRTALAAVSLAGLHFEVVGSQIGGGGGGFLPYPLNLHEGRGSYSLLSTDPAYSFPLHMPDWIAAADPTIVVMLVGTVDNVIGLPTTSTIPVVRTLVENASNSGQRVIVLVRNLPQFPTSNGTLAQIASFNTALSALAAQMNTEGHRIVVSDPGPRLGIECMSDGIHITNELCADMVGIVVGNSIVQAASL